MYLFEGIILIISFWWLWLPVVLFLFFLKLRAGYLVSKNISAIQWVLLEILIPKEVSKTPQGMEQIFTSLHSIQISPPKFIDKYTKGKIQEWLSFEIVSLGGEIHFYIRTPAQFRNLVEAQIYAQFPHSEVAEVVDYVNNLPQNIPNKNYNLWGTELILTKESFYPIKTYSQFLFEEKTEEQKVDPLASLAEALSRLTSTDQLWIQILIRPVGEDKLKKEADESLGKILGKAAPKKEKLPILSDLLDVVKGYFVGFFEEPEFAGAEKEKKEDKPKQLTPGEKDIVKAIEDKLAKLDFETAIRFVYIGRGETFSRANIAPVIGAFKQFNTKNLNGFKINGAASTSSGDIFFRERIEYLKKIKLLGAYKSRSFASKFFILNTEELATIYHFPGLAVSAPMMLRIEVKKGEPPRNLPVI